MPQTSPQTTPARLNIGLLVCGDFDPETRALHGSYADMFKNGFVGIDDQLALTPVRCFEAQFPESVDAFDGYLITGSRRSVYEVEGWIQQLQDFVRQCYAARKKTVGICFGHQLIAHALGGETRKAEVGWGIGAQRVEITETQPWMDAAPDSESPVTESAAAPYELAIIHQDQVAQLPPGFRAIANNEFCPISMFVGDDFMLGIQGHPEFTKAFCEYRLRARTDRFGEELLESALESLRSARLDSARVFRWLSRFFRA